jgi:hypothetical protein
VSRLTDARAALDMLIAEAGGQPPTSAELDAIPDAPAVVSAALARMAQLEKVAELARTSVRGSDPQAAEHATLLLDLALIELDNHPETNEDTMPTRPEAMTIYPAGPGPHAEYPPYAITAPGSHWTGNATAGWTLCTCHRGENHPTEQDSSVDVLRAAVDDLADGLRAVSETLRLDGEPIVTAERLFDLIDPLTRVAAGMRTWPR